MLVLLMMEWGVFAILLKDNEGNSENKVSHFKGLKWHFPLAFIVPSSQIWKLLPLAQPLKFALTIGNCRGFRWRSERFFRIFVCNKFAERYLFIEYANVLFPIKTFQNFVKLLTKFITHLYCSFRPHNKYGENITRKKSVQSLSSLYAESNSPHSLSFYLVKNPNIFFRKYTRPYCVL